MTSITAIITTYNRVDVLPRALKSVFSQSRPPDEVIVVDDGSIDGTANYLKDLNWPVTVIRQENSGISAARNTAIKEATGDWLTFLDDDDEWLPNKLARQLKAIQQRPGHRLCHTEEIWIRNGKRVNAMNKHKKQGGWIYTNCLPLCVISPSAVMIHREVFTDIGLFDNNLPACEDYDLWLRICAQEPVLFIDEPLIKKYGGHEDQLSRKYWGMDRFRIQALEKMLSNDQLGTDDRYLTLQMLIKKITIYVKGAIKRGKQEEVATYQQRQHVYETQLTALDNTRAETAAC